MGFELILNILILVLLAATVFFAARLSVQLDVFRKGRKDFENILNNISKSVNAAENAIQGMRAVASEEGTNLQKVIDRGRSLSDELQLIHDAGDALAERLEKLAGRTRAVAEELDDMRLTNVGKIQATKAASVPETENIRGFMIRDPDIEREEDTDIGEDILEDQFLSKAERDLYAALNKQNKKRS